MESLDGRWAYRRVRSPGVQLASDKRSCVDAGLTRRELETETDRKQAAVALVLASSLAGPRERRIAGRRPIASESKRDQGIWMTIPFAAAVASAVVGSGCVGNEDAVVVGPVVEAGIAPAGVGLSLGR